MLLRLKQHNFVKVYLTGYWSPKAVKNAKSQTHCICTREIVSVLHYESTILNIITIEKKYYIAWKIKVAISKMDLYFY